MRKFKKGDVCMVVHDSSKVFPHNRNLGSLVEVTGRQATIFPVITRTNNDDDCEVFRLNELFYIGKL